ncbi:MAG: PsbP-related protein, partial [Atribacterota bacterium]
QSINPYLVFLAFNSETQVEVTLEYRDFGSLDRFRERVRDDITVFPNVTITGEGETTIDHIPAYWFDYLFLAENTEMQGRLYLFTRKGGFYRIICLSSREHFQKHLPVFERIIQSFTFIPIQDQGP